MKAEVVPHEGTAPETLAFVKHLDFQDRVLAAGLDPVAATEAWIAEGWIDDYMSNMVPNPNGHVPEAVERLNLGPGHHRLIAIRGKVLDATAAADRPRDYVNLDQIAAIVSKSKRTLQRASSRKRNPMPAPTIEGGGGKAHEWLWVDVRSWLENEYGRQLPDCFPQRLDII